MSIVITPELKDQILRMSESDRTIAKSYFRCFNVCGNIGDKLIRMLVNMDSVQQKKKLQEFKEWRLVELNRQLEKIQIEKNKLEAIND